jgi:hypothetical protein
VNDIDDIFGAPAAPEPAAIYGAAALDLLPAGWSPLPVPRGKKGPPPEGFTGHRGRRPTEGDVVAWCRERPGDNVALRMPPDVVGLDVDAYRGGAEGLAELVERYGPLPPTVRLTSRTDGSGIALYRAPVGTILKGAPARGVDVVQHSHRYAMAPPSIHPSGAQYRCLGDADEETELPEPGELPELPWPWIEGLSVTAGPAAEVATGEAVAEFYATRTEALARGRLRGLETLLDQRHRAGAGRHDTLLEVACMAMREAAAGAYTADEAEAVLGAWWADVMDDADRRDGPEFGHAIAWAVAQASVDHERVEAIRAELLAHPDDSLDELASSTPAQDPDLHDLPDLDEFLDGADEPYAWIIPGLIEAGDRVILTGEEGGGKSTLLRQVAVQASSGVHPFTLEPIEPVPVLLVDTENSIRQTRRALRPLRDTAGGRYRAGRLHLHVVGHALDLARPEVYADLAAKVTRYRPRLIVIGPLYKLTDGDPIKEEPARALADRLDHLRALTGAAVIIEAHTPYADGSRAKRPRRPYGASLWSRWPEFGVFLSPEGDLDHWRGQRDERSWPHGLRRGAEWPWTVRGSSEPTETWDGPTKCMEAIVAYLDAHPGEEVSTRQMPTRLREVGLSYRDSIVGQALDQLAAEGRIRCVLGPRRSRLYSARLDDLPTLDPLPLEVSR